jgi:MSHA biogenesis protein MshP
MNNQRGFSIVMAIFVLIVLGLLGSYMVSLSGVQINSANYAFQGARAYQAARAGIEWAIADISLANSCTQVNAETAMTFTGINGFTVTLTCSASSAYYEGSNSYIVYTVTSLSQFGSYSSNNYIARQIQTTIVLP